MPLRDARGYAVDDARGLFFTNLEETDETLAIDVRSREVRARWKPRCDDSGLLFAAAGRAATLTVAHADDDGLLRLVASRPTVRGARNAVVDALGTA